MTYMPINSEDMQQRGWDELDFLFISGDAYVDHPSFGAALLTRLLEAEGYRVGIIAQPPVNRPDCLKIMGRPRLGVFVSSGVVDSMVDNYTAALRRRSDDRYSATLAQPGQRPDRALIRYCDLVRQQFGDIPLIIGGIEGSLRRFGHYDYWSDRVRRSILQDSRADLLIYGMGELPILTVAGLLAKGASIKSINKIRGTCLLARPDQLPNACADFINKFADFRLHPDAGKKQNYLKNPFPQDDQFIMLPPFEEVAQDPLSYAIAFRVQYQEQDPGQGKTLIQRHGDRFVVQNPPQRPMTTQEMDRLYTFPYMRRPHPIYDVQGGVPAIAEVGMSVNSHRGCFGGCNFCAITFHQGRIIQRRSEASILSEVELLTRQPDFKGYIHDIGGPTANFFEPACEKQKNGAVCKNRQCLFPKPCPQLKVDHAAYLAILRKARQVDRVKKVFIRSGIRFDYCMLDPSSDFMEELCRHHVSGQLKVAPEHVSEHALQAMGKPSAAVYEKFRQVFTETNKRIGKDQYLVPYLISGHPGCTLADAIELALYIKANRVMPEQVQDFYPTPGTVSTTMYHTGLDPLTLEAVHVPDLIEKKQQRALLQFRKPENRTVVQQALARAGRADLIGYGPDCLVIPTVDRSGRRGEQPDSHPGPRTDSPRAARSDNPSGARFASPRGVNPDSRQANDRNQQDPQNREDTTYGNHHSRQGTRSPAPRPTGRKSGPAGRTDRKKTGPGRYPGRG